MCHSLLFGVILGVIVSRVLWRLRWGRHGGGCHGGAWRRGWDGLPEGSFAPGRWRAGFRAATSINHRPVSELVSGLGLNQRQQQEAATVFALLGEQLGERGPQVTAALQAVAAEPFDRGSAEAALAQVAPTLRRELVDGLEHVHTILIPEQREQLRQALAGQGRDSK